MSRPQTLRRAGKIPGVIAEVDEVSIANGMIAKELVSDMTTMWETGNTSTGAASILIADIAC